MRRLVVPNIKELMNPTRWMVYSTDNRVKVKSHRIAFMYRISQLAIISYIIAYQLWYKKSYQNHDSVQSGVITKINGFDKSVIESVHDSLNNEMQINSDTLKQIYDTMGILLLGVLPYEPLKPIMTNYTPFVSVH